MKRNLISFPLFAAVLFIPNVLWAGFTCYDSVDRYNTCRYTKSDEECSKGFIKDYTSLLSAHLNEYMRGQSDNEYCKTVADKLQTAVMKLPSYSGIVYRGESFFPLLKQIKINNINDCYIDTAFLSASKDLKVAKNFAFAGEAILKINTINARDISDISYLKEEQEVLLLPKTLLKFLKKPYVIQGRTYFEFREVDASECTTQTHSLDN